MPHSSLSVTLETSEALRAVALGASYWTLLIEGVVAIAFLLAGIQWLAHARDWLLLLFVATTYFLLPVLGFAYVILIMGLAQCSSEHTGKRLVYLGLFASLQLARLPWEQLVI